MRPAQDAYIGTIDSPSNNHYDTDGKTVVGVIRTSHFIRANWDGSVAVGLWSADDFAPSVTDPEALITECWAIAAKINAQLGGYGPAYLSVQVVVAKSGEVEVVGQQARAAGRPPPPGTVYARLPELTIIGRLLDSAEPNSTVVESIGREIHRASGRRADEPGEREQGEASGSSPDEAGQES